MTTLHSTHRYHLSRCHQSTLSHAADGSYPHMASKQNAMLMYRHQPTTARIKRVARIARMFHSWIPEWEAVRTCINRNTVERCCLCGRHSVISCHTIPFWKRFHLKNLANGQRAACPGVAGSLRVVSSGQHRCSLPECVACLRVA